MNRKSVTSLLLAALCLLASCSKKEEAADSLPEGQYPPQQQVSVSLKLEAEVDEEALRAMNYKLESKAGRSIFPWLKLGTATVPVHCVIRSDDASDSPTFLTLQGKPKDGTNALVIAEDGLTINAGDFTKTKGLAGRKWYIMALIGGTPELDGGGKMTGKIKFRSTSTPLSRVPLGGEGSADVPYTSGWVELELRTISGSTEMHGGALGKLRFKPRGSLLRVQFHNDLPVSHVQVYQYITVAKYMDSHVDFSLNVPLTTQTATWAYAEAKPTDGYTRRYHLAAKTLDMPAQTADNAYYLLWVMPDGSGNRGYTSYFDVKDRVKMRAMGLNHDLDDNLQLCVLGSDSKHDRVPMQDGVSYRTVAKVGANWNPLADISDRNIAGAPPNFHFAPNLRNDATGLYTINEATLIANQFANQGYHLPKIEEWTTILGESRSWAIYHPTENISRTHEERTFYRGTERRVIASYQSYTRHPMAYGVRFKGSDVGGTVSQNYSAWRYYAPYPGAAGDAGVGLEIKSVYLGPGAHEEITTIAIESWWNNLSPLAKAQTITKYVPFCSHKFLGDATKYPHDVALIWSATPSNMAPWPHFLTVLLDGYGTPSNNSFFTEYKRGWGSYDGNLKYHGVRLFIN